tara:strand:+ start:495 stop:1016 length:522 start_codon:yes stop_codon:yes gene_type:complete
MSRNPNKLSFLDIGWFNMNKDFKKKTMITLRPHHLLCILTYIGEGYSRDFTQNMTQIVERINQGERDILICEGPDDICAPRIDAMRSGKDPECHCLTSRITKRDRAAAKELEAILGQTIQNGSILILSCEKIAQLRHAFRQGEIRKACRDCQWFDLCTKTINQCDDDKMVLVG